VPHPLVSKGAGFDVCSLLFVVSERAGFPVMQTPLRRYYGKGHLHFITFSCYRRRPFLGTRRSRDCFVKTLEWARVRQGFRLAGYVVMPEHVHLLISEPALGNPSKAIQVLKRKVSRILRGRRGKIPCRQLQFAFGESVLEAKHF
jgi:REP element-mobilizing transposase RayT